MRHEIRLTIILDPRLALLCWVHYAPALNDSFRVSYRKFLRWNDELPFVKFALSADERPVLTSEIGLVGLDRDGLGLAIARLLWVCDLLAAESISWLWPGARRVPVPTRPSRNEALLDRYALQLAELAGQSPSAD